VEWTVNHVLKYSKVHRGFSLGEGSRGDIGKVTQRRIVAWL